jgi:hypothetical protein
MAVNDWRDDLPWGYGRRVREIEGRWQYAKSYSDAEAAQDVAELVAILGVVQRELDESLKRELGELRRSMKVQQELDEARR